jgi:hypothetical protein
LIVATAFGLLRELTRGRIVAHQTTDDLWITGVAANDPVRAEKEDVARPRYRRRAGRRLERPSLQAVRFLPQQNVVDLGGNEARDLNRRIDAFL